MATTQSIKSKLNRLEYGKPYTTSTFLEFGTRAAVDQALARLVKEGILTRPARGVYVRPKKNPYVGTVPPSTFAIVSTIARQTGHTIQVHGSEAARQMGFSTQVPMKTIFYTDGPNRTLQIHGQDVTLKKVSAKKLALKGLPGIALNALWYLGKESVTDEAIRKVESRLTPTEFEQLRTASMPGWLHDALHRFAKDRIHD